MIEPAQFFKCLSEETRLNATLLILNEGQLCVCELMEALGESQPKISRHLTQLRYRGILDDVRRGQWVFYSIAKHLPVWALEILRAANAASIDILKTHQQNLQAMPNRPQCC